MLLARTGRCLQSGKVVGSEVRLAHSSKQVEDWWWWWSLAVVTATVIEKHERMVLQDESSRCRCYRSSISSEKKPDETIGSEGSPHPE